MATILDANMLHINFCLFKETLMAPKGLRMEGWGEGGKGGTKQDNYSQHSEIEL